jgi:predicted alpha/beta-fold hydrolase
MSSLQSLWESIDSIPNAPRRIPEPFGTVLFALPDLPAFIFQNGYRFLPFLPACAPFYYPYHAPFRRRIFNLPGSVCIDAVVAEKPGSNTMVVLVHGIFQSKNFKFIRDMAQELYSHHSVVVLDTRDHLGSSYLSLDSPASGGTIEGSDILAITRQLKKEHQALKIFLVGFSYGGGIVLNALSNESAKEVISGVVAVSPTIIISHAVSHIDTDPGIGSPFYPIYNLFQTCLRLRHGLAIRTFHEYLEKAAERYGFTPDDMLRRSSLPSFIHSIEIPALLLIAKNDPVIPEGDIGTTARMAKTSDYVHLMVRQEGGHIAFSFIDKRWFYRLIEEFTGYTRSDP